MSVLTRPMPQRLRDLMPRVDDQASNLRRTGGRFLVLTRAVMTALHGAPDVQTRVVIADRFAHHARGLLADLRTLEFDPTPAFQALTARALDRITAIRSAIPALSDASDALSLLAAELLILSGDLDAARGRLEPMMLSIARVQSRDLRDEIADRYLDLSIASMRGRDGAIMFVTYLSRRLMHGQGGSRFARQMRLLARHPEILRSAGLGRTDRLVRAWNQVTHVPPRRLSTVIADLVLQRIGPSVIRRDLRAVGTASGMPRVVRAMGGIGDLLMMTPGLRALSKRFGQSIEFGVPGRFLPLFDQNPWVTAMALEALPADWFTAGPLIDLTDCPASLIESRTAPDIRINRIEIFAQAMGISTAELRTHGSRPHFIPSDDARLRAQEWLAARALSGQSFVAVQASSAEAYRTWTGMPAIARALADAMPVVVFDDKPPPGFDDELAGSTGIHFAIKLDLALSFALACEARMIVAPDSAFVHLSGARDIPCVSVFGPTDGALRTSAYAGGIVVSRTGELPCAPCWRNQRIPCSLTGGMASQCLQSLPVDTVHAAVTACLATARGDA